MIKRSLFSLSALGLFVGLASGSQVPAGGGTDDAELWLDIFLILNNCNGPTPIDMYISSTEMGKRGIPDYGQQINNFCYDTYTITSVREVDAGVEAVAVVGNSSYCHELTFMLVEEDFDWRTVPGTWHSDTSYVDPWVSERRNISHPDCPYQY